MDDSKTGSVVAACNKAGTNHGAAEWDAMVDDTPTPTEPSRCSAQMRRIQHHQEELRKKREEDGRLRQGQTSINSSLRLKMLSQDPCPKEGIDNPTFEPAYDGEDAGLGECELG